MCKLTTGTGLIVVALVLAGCSDYEPATSSNKREIQQCLNSLQAQIDSINKGFSKNKPDPNNKYDAIYMEKQSALSSAIYETSTAYRTATENGELHQDYVDSDGRYICSEESIYKEYSNKLFELERDTALENANAANKQIDQALVDVIDDYKKKAVEHKVTNSGGLRIDMFVMRSGAVVYCKTTVTDAGKAVDCN